MTGKKKAKSPGKKKPKRHHHGRKRTFHVITIENGDPTPTLKIVVSEHDRVSWANRDAQDWWVKFLPTWPFAVGEEELIQVEAGHATPWFRVEVNPGAGKQMLYRYALKKNPTDPDPPPDGPGVIADG